MGVSRDTFYRYRELIDEGSVDELINRSCRTPNLNNCIDEDTERTVIDHAIVFLAYSQHWTSNELRKQYVFISVDSVSRYYYGDVTENEPLRDYRYKRMDISRAYNAVIYITYLHVEYQVFI